MNQRKRVRKPRAFTIHGCEIFSVRESMMGGEFISILGTLLPMSDVKKLRKKIDEGIGYLEREKKR